MKFLRLYTIFPLACPFTIYVFLFHLFLPLQYWHFQFLYCELSFSPILQKQSQPKISTIFQGFYTAVNLSCGTDLHIEKCSTVIMFPVPPASPAKTQHPKLNLICSLFDTCSTIKYYVLPCSLFPLLAYPSFPCCLCCELTLIIGLMIRRGNGSIF